MQDDKKDVEKLNVWVTKQRINTTLDLQKLFYTFFWRENNKN